MQRARRAACWGVSVSAWPEAQRSLPPLGVSLAESISKTFVAWHFARPKATGVSFRQMIEAAERLKRPVASPGHCRHSHAGPLPGL